MAALPPVTSPATRPSRAIRASATAKPVPKVSGAELEAVEREKARLSIELHDGVGQHLTGIAFLAKALANRLHAAQAAEAGDADQIVLLTNEAIAKLRAMARGLRPIGPEDNALTVALAQLVRDANSVFGAECLFVADQPVTIANPLVSHQLYRIAQEGIHNAVKHGRASRITVDLVAKGRSITLSVTNAGDLHAPRSQAQQDSPGIGVAGMRYRAGLIGGQFSLVNVRGEVRLRVTVNRKAAEALPHEGELQ